MNGNTNNKREPGTPKELQRENSLELSATMSMSATFTKDPHLM